VEVRSARDAPAGSIGAGCIHHVAFRTSGQAEQLAWQQLLRDTGVAVTDVKDRTYFHSIYFAEPGGVRFEIATDSPGFTVDESRDQLGTRLQLPPDAEARRHQLEAGLDLPCPVVSPAR
jgi:glyoxalase family protein